MKKPEKPYPGPSFQELIETVSGGTEMLKRTWLASTVHANQYFWGRALEWDQLRNTSDTDIDLG